MKKEVNEKITAVFGVIIITLLFILLGILYPLHKEDMTEEYMMYNRLRDYTNTAELEEYLTSNNIRYEKEIGDIYVYPSREKKQAIQFITLENECKIVPIEYVTNFKKLDIREDVQIIRERGEEYIVLIKGSKKYLYSQGRYYIATNYTTKFEVIRIIGCVAVTFFNIFLIYIAFFYKKKE